MNVHALTMWERFKCHSQKGEVIMVTSVWLELNLKQQWSKWPPVAMETRDKNRECEERESMRTSPSLICCVYDLPAQYTLARGISLFLVSCFPIEIIIYCIHITTYSISKNNFTSQMTVFIIKIVHHLQFKASQNIPAQPA